MAESPLQEMAAPAAPERILKISCHNCMQKLDVTSLMPFSHISCPTCGADLIVPEWFDDYLLEEPGGSGGMAMVYRALDLALDREVAIKILKPELSHDSARSELFLREARTAATINHYAVVPIYTCGVFEDRTYIIMQYMAGGSLEQKLRQSPEPLPQEQVMRWMCDIAGGLENASMHGIIHHDVKPGNILLDVEGNAKIGDFGIAQIVSRPGENIYDARNWISPHYVSPEKVRTGEEGVRGDIYSLGATFYHLITGMTPFNHDDLEELIRMRLTVDPAPPHLLRKDISVELSQLILSMMSRNPADRPSYKTITATLNRIIKEKSSATVPLPVRSIQKKRNAAAGKIRKSKKAPFGFFILLILLVLVAGGALAAWKTGFLDFQEPEMETKVEVVEQRTDPNSAATFHFSMGDPAAALLCADLVLHDPDVSLHQRAAALFQAACALYLNSESEAEAKISARLSVMNNLYSAAEMMQENMLLSLTGGMAGSEADEVEPTADGQGAACAAAARLFRAMKGGPAAGGKITKLLSDLEEKLANLAESEWPAQAWKNRIGIWKNAVWNRSGRKSETEPLAAQWIEQEEQKSVFSENLLPETPERWMEEESDVWESEEEGSPDISAESLKTAAAFYMGKGRPRPKAPAEMRKINMSEYLNVLSEPQRQAEKLRLRMMGETVRFICESSARVPYQTDSFLTVDGHVLDAGVWSFNPCFMVRRTDTKIEALAWEKASAPEVMGIMLYYTTRLEAVSSADAAKGSRQLLMFYVRYALFAQWYGFYEEASKYAQKAVTMFPDRRSADFIRLLLLR